MCLLDDFQVERQKYPANSSIWLVTTTKVRLPPLASFARACVFSHRSKERSPQQKLLISGMCASVNGSGLLNKKVDIIPPTLVSDAPNAYVQLKQQGLVHQFQVDRGKHQTLHQKGA